MSSELSAELQSIFDDSERTPAGRSFYPADDPMMREAARTLAPQAGRYVVDIHGTADRAKVGPHWLDADDLAALIRAAPEWDGQDVFLMSCDSGRREDGFAQQLSDALRVDVVAPDKLAWSDFEPGGGAQPYSSDGCLDASGVPRPIKPPTGTFVTFVPRDHQQDRTGDDRTVQVGDKQTDTDRVEFAGTGAGEVGTAEVGTARAGADETPPEGARLGMLHRQSAGRPLPPVMRGEPAAVGVGSRQRGTLPGRQGAQVRGE